MPLFLIHPGFQTPPWTGFKAAMILITFFLSPKFGRIRNVKNLENYINIDDRFRYLLGIYFCIYRHIFMVFNHFSANSLIEPMRLGLVCLP